MKIGIGQMGVEFRKG